MSMRTLLVVASILCPLAACGGDDGGSTDIDAASSTVSQVTCGGATIAATVTAPGFAFTPMSSTISVGQIVQFDMPSSHNAVSDSSGLFRADFNASTCFRFDAAGSYGFHCEPHAFTGTIVVQ